MSSSPNDPPDPEFSDVVARAIAHLDSGLEKRLGDDPQAHLDLVVLTRRAHDEVGNLLGAAVTAARAAGWSWEAIGSSLDMSRQAAQQRFGRLSEPAPEATEGRRLVGLTAMGEMDTLADWGRRGWHSVGFGPMFHDVVKSDVQWDHCRAVVGSRAARGLERNGWERIGTMWFPWIYFKRSTDRPAESGE
ncbi:MAG: hypothetical protein WB508_00155 [Aeromicrobium sp.]|uniref:hypothetical protein n=1 Tax=Aeromicrobium sp. TaxID=1871063 RepID=UPI003C58F32D